MFRGKLHTYTYSCTCAARSDSQPHKINIKDISGQMQPLVILQAVSALVQYIKLSPVYCQHIQFKPLSFNIISLNDNFFLDGFFQK